KVSNQESETRWCAKAKQLGIGQTLFAIGTKVDQLVGGIAEYEALSPAHVAVHIGDARQSPLKSESVDFVVTSPPYANSHDYYLYNKLRLFWLGHDVGVVQRAEIGSRNRHSDQ